MTPPVHRISISNANGLVLYAEGQIVSIHGLGTATEAFYGTGLPTSGLLAPALRWISTDGCGYIFERPPGSVTISYKATKAGGKRSVGTYNINLPWQVYYLRFSDAMLRELTTGALFVRGSSITSPDDLLCNSCLPNIGPRGQFCLGDGRNQFIQLASGDDRHSNTVNRQILSGINAYWCTEFNRDMSGVPYGLPPQAADNKVHTWAQYLKLLSKTPIEELVGWDWNPYEFYNTVGDSPQLKKLTVGEVMSSSWPFGGDISVPQTPPSLLQLFQTILGRKKS